VAPLHVARAAVAPEHVEEEVAPGGAAAKAPGAGRAKKGGGRASASSDAAAGPVLELPPLAHPIEIRADGGARVAVVGPSVRPVRVALAPGRYELLGPGGGRIVWETGASPPALPEAWRAPPPPVSDEPARVRSSDRPPPDSPGRDSDRAEPTPAELASIWRWYVFPAASAIIPGTGQMLNGEPGKGAAILLSTAGLLTATIMLWPRTDPREGTGGRADDTIPATQEVARLAGFGVASGALGLLYAGQILDAHQVARGQPVRPNKDFVLRIELAGLYTIATRPGQPSHQLLRDFNVSFMFEPVPRFNLGFSDIGGGRDRQTGRRMSQAGVRFGYRVFDRRRTWITLSVGGVFQSAGRDGGAGARGAVSGFVYGQLGLRIFVTDAISLGLFPRLSVPLATRFYAFGGSLPRYAPTLELGGGIGVHF